MTLGIDFINANVVPSLLKSKYNFLEKSSNDKPDTTASIGLSFICLIKCETIRSGSEKDKCSNQDDQQIHSGNLTVI